jgi:nucleotide-binding universal stress UspA family protein
MYKTILVPLDGSERAEKILPHVETLAKHSGAKVILLRVIEAANNVPFLLKATPDTWRNMVRVWNETAENYLSAQRDRLAEQGIEADFRVEYGPITATIITVAEEEDVDLIAMSSHGATGLSRVFYGSVASGVLHRVNRPLLLIRAN